MGIVEIILAGLGVAFCGMKGTNFGYSLVAKQRTLVSPINVAMAFIGLIIFTGLWFVGMHAFVLLFFGFVFVLCALAVQILNWILPVEAEETDRLTAPKKLPFGTLTIPQASHSTKEFETYNSRGEIVRHNVFAGSSH